MSSPDITLTVDGRTVRAAEGVTVAAALLDAGVHAFRRSVRGDARAPLCGMGICHECRVTIDGVPHRRACLVPVAPHMVVRTAERGAAERGT
jgi:aerobic-type carbon monoxide dehydrogenase small subunit (CoxS/CutS family)